VTIIRVRPRLIGLGVFIVGLIAGLVWAYGIAPTIWTDATPVHLHHSYQLEWVKMATDQYARTGDEAQAGRMFSLVGDAVSLLDEVRAEAESSGNRDYAALLNQARGIALGVGADASNPELDRIDYGGLQTMSPIVLVLLVAIIGGIIVILHGMYGMMFGMIIKGLIPRRRKAPAGGSAGQGAEGGAAAGGVGDFEAERRRIVQEARAREQAAPAPQDANLPAPVSQFMSAYIMGDDYYDDSFSIEDEDGGFLGETGAGISETIGVGAPKKVTATEVWLFDKNDIRTITKVIMSEHAYNDEALRAKLAPKGDAVLARPGERIQLETQTLQIIATIRDMEYGTGALPPNSFFERLSLEIVAYAKEGATSAPGTAADMYDGTMPLG
jgi:hypothetical protein